MRCVLGGDGTLVSVVALEMGINDQVAVFRREDVTPEEEGFAITIPADEVG